MSKQVTINIDGKDCQAKEGEFILNVARANGIFVPALCYLTRCSPTLACRLCLVEADGKQVYSCNAKVKDGMVIKTSTDNIEKERTAIIEVYDVNHPLQCGVCDQSGECELQNYNIYQNIQRQDYAVRDVHRPASVWGVMKYDPGLCIVCEKCVTVCKDMIGSQALSTVKRGADALDKDFKATMPKDAYAMWNKLNKSLIGFDEDKCIECGECISVCPVGALVSTDFQYKSNAWELKRIPASNPHSSDCSLIYYEVKRVSIDKNKEQKIYRVTNDSHYVSLNGAARFAFDYSNLVKSKDQEEFNKAIEAFKNSDSILFNSFITNEEAYILQQIKEKTGAKLINEDALRYKTFISEYSKVCGKKFYTGTVKDIHNGKIIISVGSYLKSDVPSAKYAYNNAITINKANGIYFHAIGDKHIDRFGKKGKTTQTIINKPYTEDAILYLILDVFAHNLPEDIKEYLVSKRDSKVKTVVETIKEKVVETVTNEETGETKEITKMVPKKVSKEVEYRYNKLLDVIGGADDEVFEMMFAFHSTLVGQDVLKNCNDEDWTVNISEKSSDYVLILGEDCIKHPNYKNIAHLAGIVEKYTPFKVIIPPTQTNTLGVSLICDLDSEVSGKTVGYNVQADYQISALGDGDLDMPVLNQQEGTFVNIDKRVVPTNAALSYNGYELNDIANEILDTKVEYTIDYTEKLFNNIKFDDLKNEFKNNWQEDRGYILDNDTVDIENIDVLCENKALEVDENSFIIYNGNPINQFNEFTAKASQFKDDIVALYLSDELSKKLDVSNENKVKITKDNNSVILDVRVDNNLIGDISYVPTFDKNCETKKLFDDTRFSIVNIEKV